MLIVLDTNVIISALLSPHGPPAEILARWEAEEFSVAISPSLLAELDRALHYPKVQTHLKQPQETIQALLKRLLITAVVVHPTATLDVIRQDPADNRVLECASAADASYIVTGDEHLLGLREFEGIVILRPAEFFLSLNFEGGSKEE